MTHAYQLLDYPQLHHDLKSPFTNALLKLSGKSGLYPECLTLNGVQRLGNPVAAGTFGDVWKGIIRGESVAVKVLRIYQKTDMEKHLKVVPFFSLPLYLE
jgi:predicted unusual protein kinase regulating ubiquinone biosynthesis (AarF/ABC1/UbiB family)